MDRFESGDMWVYERAAMAEGWRVIAGVDEAGRGPLAGPVVAAAVILPPFCDTLGIRDSKTLSSSNRNSAFRRILSLALSVGVGVVEEQEIDRINILRATHRAMRAAVCGLHTPVDLVLVDGHPIHHFEYPQRAIVRGDSKSASIAAASIVAKVVRDRIMCIYDTMFPQYGFARHKGYATEEHLRSLALYGVCEIHRKSFAPVARYLNTLWDKADLSMDRVLITTRDGVGNSPQAIR